MGYIRKIDAMHEYFGTDESHTCKTCENLLKLCYRDDVYYKCKCYGITPSEASDFRQKWTACGLYNQKYDGTPLIEVLKHEPKPTKDEQIEGQMEISDYFYGDFGLGHIVERMANPYAGSSAGISARMR